MIPYNWCYEHCTKSYRCELLDAFEQTASAEIRREGRKDCNDCLRKRYFMYLKLCKEGKEEEAGRLFTIPCPG